MNYKYYLQKTTILVYSQQYNQLNCDHLAYLTVCKRPGVGCTKGG